jgi:hypothetical protein
VKSKRSEIVRKVSKIPEVRYEDQGHSSLTSFAGLVIYQQLFQRLKLMSHLRAGLAHLAGSATYGAACVFLWLIVHLLLGYRRLRERDFYADDPLVQRLLGLTQLPDTSTICRTLAKFDEQAIQNLRALLRRWVLDRLLAEEVSRVTLDFDGSVFSTGRHAEGTAIGFNRKKKGARSYYPLFCTVAQTGQFFDLHHRSGNVHDSNGSLDFILDCVSQVRQALPQAKIESRIDSAFFDEERLVQMHLAGVEFTVSVPFERFPHLKAQVEARQRWLRIDDTWSYFECDWKPDKWTFGFRVLIVRQKKKQPTKGPLQLELFEPVSHEYQYQVIMTNKGLVAAGVIDFHHGRGSQEGIFAEGKTHCRMEYVPVRKWFGNQAYCLAALFAHNLTRELQMRTSPQEHRTNRKRRPLWCFETLGTLRGRLLRQAGRLIRPQGRLTMVVSSTSTIRKSLEKYLAL